MDHFVPKRRANAAEKVTVRSNSALRRTVTKESLSTLKQTLIDAPIFDTNKCSPNKSWQNTLIVENQWIRLSTKSGLDEGYIEEHSGHHHNYTDKEIFATLDFYQAS